MSDSVPAESGAARIAFAEGVWTGKTVAMADNECTIGRGTDNQIAIPEDPAISRRHCTIRRLPGGEPAFDITDHNTVNGTYLNGQFLSMGFAQFTYRESLRDIEACLRSVSGKLYHMGFHGRVSRSTLADANESRDWRIFADFAQVLIAIARPLYAGDPIGVDLDASLYALDSTTNRPLPFAVPVGPVPPTQGRRQTAYAAGPAR